MFLVVNYLNSFFFREWWIKRLFYGCLILWNHQKLWNFWKQISTCYNFYLFYIYIYILGFLGLLKTKGEGEGGRFGPLHNSGWFELIWWYGSSLPIIQVKESCSINNGCHGSLMTSLQSVKTFINILVTLKSNHNWSPIEIF